MKPKHVTPEKEQLIRECLRYEGGHLYWRVNRRGGVKAGDVAGNTRLNGYIETRVGGNVFLVHRIVFFLHYGYWPEYIDHINRDRADNRVENLRECTVGQNQYNSAKRPNTKFGRNIDWNSNQNKYVVRIQVKGRRLLCGYFDDLELAELVASEAREKYHGEYAYKETNE